MDLRIIEEETSVLSDADAARADRVLAGAAPGLTFGEVRRAAHQLVLKLDPEAAKKRKEAARGEAHVRRFREASGNAGMVARELPSDEVLASWQHVEQRALDLRAAGIPGTLQELRVRAYLDLLQERDSRDLPAGGQASVPDQSAPDGQSSGSPDPDAGPSGSGGPGGNGGTAARVALAVRTSDLVARAAPVPVLARHPRPPLARVPGPVSRRWSPSPSPWPPGRAGPRRRARPTGSGSWTATTPVTWPPPPPATPAPAGASPC